jgi:hypothetical protein
VRTSSSRGGSVDDYLSRYIFGLTTKRYVVTTAETALLVAKPIIPSFCRVPCMVNARPSKAKLNRSMTVTSLGFDLEAPIDSMMLSRVPSFFTMVIGRKNTEKLTRSIRSIVAAPPAIKTGREPVRM